METLEYVNCSGCHRSHPKPTGPQQCPYKKAAVAKCNELGAEEKDFLLFFAGFNLPKRGKSAGERRSYDESRSKGVR